MGTTLPLWIIAVTLVVIGFRLWLWMNDHP